MDRKLVGGSAGLRRLGPAFIRFHWANFDSLGLTWAHLDSLRLIWTHSGLIGLVGTHLDLLGDTWTHLDSLRLTSTHFGFTRAHLDSLWLTWIHSGFLWHHLDPLTLKLIGAHPNSLQFQDNLEGVDEYNEYHITWLFDANILTCQDIGGAVKI